MKSVKQESSVQEPTASDKPTDKKIIDVDEDDDDEEDDEDYDPEKKQQDEADESSDDDEEDGRDDKTASKIPDYSKIESNTSQVKTRSQRLHERISKQSKFIGNFEVDSETGLVKEQSNLDMDSIFDSLKNAKSVEEVVEDEELKEGSVPVTEPKDVEETNQLEGPKQIQIQVSYAFAGKLVTETKLVDENSQEAKAYLNSTSSITSFGMDNENQSRRSEVKVFRTDPITKETKELRIKLKRPSIIDRFIAANGNLKKMKLSTLEKSRLDWASYVDKSKINEELKLHNKSGYLDKQEFIDRMNAKRDDIYLQAKEEERKRNQRLLQK